VEKVIYLIKIDKWRDIRQVIILINPTLLIVEDQEVETESTIDVITLRPPLLLLHQEIPETEDIIPRDTVTETRKKMIIRICH
jgi:hypothetical protein